VSQQITHRGPAHGEPARAAEPDLPGAHVLWPTSLSGAWVLALTMPIAPYFSPMRLTTDWRAGCGRSARPGRRVGDIVVPTPIKKTYPLAWKPPKRKNKHSTLVLIGMTRIQGGKVRLTLASCRRNISSIWKTRWWRSRMPRARSNCPRRST